MLVLSRRTKDVVSFPQVGISIHFIRIQSGSVKVGIDAPRDIAIVRDEIESEEVAASLVRKQLTRLPKDVRHGIRNELHAISVGLHLFHEELKAGLTEQAALTFADLQESISSLDQNSVLQRPEIEEVSSKPHSILLVEDDPNERAMLAGFLRLKGHQVIDFQNGREALNYLATNDAPQFVLTDMDMPVCDGATLVKRMRSNEKLENSRVFAISGTSPKENGLETGPDGVNRWFPKPLNPVYLIEEMEKDRKQNLKNSNQKI